MKIQKNTVKQTMRLLDGPAGKIQAISLSNTHVKKEQILVLPNGYGALEYSKTLGSVLSKKWSNILIPNLRGQGASDGELSIKGGAEDIIYLCNKIRSNSDRKITIIVHCSAIFYLLSLVQEKKFWDGVEKIILYGYLARPTDHTERFIKKAKKYGVKGQFSRDEIAEFHSHIYSDIPVPFFVVHPLSVTNLARANKSQLDELMKNGNPELILTPEKGYEILDIAQDSAVSSIVTDCFNPIISGVASC